MDPHSVQLTHNRAVTAAGMNTDTDRRPPDPELAPDADTVRARGHTTAAGTVAWLFAVVLCTAVGVALMHRSDRRLHDGPAGGGETALRVGYALEPPYAYRDPQGRLQGESIEAARAALRRLGLGEPVWVHVEFPRLIHELRMGRIDLIAAGLFVTPDRARLAAFTRPTTTVRTALLVPRGNPLALHALADLRGQPSARTARLAVIDGSVELDQAREAGLDDGQILRLPDAAAGMAAVRAGDAAAFALSAPSLRWMLSASGAGGALELASPMATPTRQGRPDMGLPALAVRPGDPLLDRLDRALEGYVGSPEHLATAVALGFAAEEIAAARGVQAGTAQEAAR